MRRRRQQSGAFWDRRDARVRRRDRRAQRRQRRRDWRRYRKARRREERRELKALILNGRQERRTRQQERRQTRKARREERKTERKDRHQERKTERKDRRRERKTERQERKTERKERHQERRTERKDRRQQRKTERQEQRQERKAEHERQRVERKAERTKQRQERKTGRKDRRQKRKEQRQQRRTERKDRRQQRKTERQEQRQERKAERERQRVERKAERTKQRQERKVQRIERRDQRRRDRRLRIKRAVVGTNRFLGRTRPPLPDPDFVETPTKSARVSLLSATLCLSVAALMVSGKIVEIADRLPLGAERDRWVAAAEGADRVGNWLSLNRPYDAVRELRGAGDDAGQRVDVIGDLEDLLAQRAGADSKPSSTTGPPPSTDIESDGALTTVTEDPSGAVAADSSGHQPSTSGATPEDPEDPSAATIGAQQDPADSIGDTAEVVEDPTAATEGVPDTPSGELPTTSGALIDPTTAGTERPAVEPGEEDGLDPPEVSEQSVTELRLAPVSEEVPLRAYVAGDSQAFYLGVELRAGRLSKVLELTLDERQSTGLARPGYFNWPAHLLSVSTEPDPELLVMTMGNNDWQHMRSQDNEILRRGSGAWRAEWGRRLGVMFDLMEASHRHILWVGLPPARSASLREGYAVINEIAVEMVAARDFVTMIDTWELFGGDEPYRASLPPPDDPEGSPVQVRQGDGVHLNRRGAGWVVAVIEEEIRRIWDPVEG